MQKPTEKSLKVGSNLFSAKERSLSSVCFLPLLLFSFPDSWGAPSTAPIAIQWLLRTWSTRFCSSLWPSLFSVCGPVHWEYSLSMQEWLQNRSQRWSLLSWYFRYTSNMVNINYISITIVQSLYRKISWVCCRLYCYSCCAQVTMPTATNEWYLFRYSLVLWW